MAEIEKDKGDSDALKPLVGTYDLTGLALTWDDVSNLRTRMRQSLNLVAHFDPKFKKLSCHEPDRSVANVKANADVLSPLCRIIFRHSGQLPHIDKLAEEIRIFYSISEQKIGIEKARKQAWSIRHLLSVLKNTYRVNVKRGEMRMPKDSSSQTKQYVHMRRSRAKRNN